MRPLSLEDWMHSGRAALLQATTERLLDDSFPETDHEPLNSEVPPTDKATQ